MADGLININGDSVQTLEIVLLMGMITLLPSLIIMMTSFTRYIISFSFLRSAMGTQQTPPNLVLVGMALILTYYTMSPTLIRIKTEAYDPYAAETVSQVEFLQLAADPLKDFMLDNTKWSSLTMFCELAQVDVPADRAEAEELPLRIITPSFVTCELQRAFEIGLLLYIPFMLIDVVVSCTLMSMGMVMLPPSMISAPFKLLLFVMLNGWELLFSNLAMSFH